MGAEPRWATLALTCPKPDELWLEGFSRGLFELAERHGVSLVGGNLARGPLSVTIQLMGRVEQGRILTRARRQRRRRRLRDRHARRQRGRHRAHQRARRDAARVGGRGSQGALLPPGSARRGRARAAFACERGDRRVRRLARGPRPHLREQRLRRADRRRARAAVGGALVDVPAADRARARARGRRRLRALLHCAAVARRGDRARARGGSGTPCDARRPARRRAGGRLPPRR